MRKIIQKILENLRSIDLFGTQVNLLIKKETEHRTLFGSFLTLGLLVLITILAINQGQEMILRTNPQTLVSEVYKASPDYVLFNKYNFTLAFGIEYRNQSTFVDESIYVPDVKLVYKYAKIQPDGTSQIVFERTQVPVIVCGINKIYQPEMKLYFQSFNINTQYCIDYEKMESFAIEGTYDALKFQYLQIDLFPCNNDTRKGQINGQPYCRTPEVLDQVLQKGIFSLQLTSSNVNLKDPENPHQIVGKDIFTTISNKLTKQIDLYLRPITTSTDEGFITEDLQKVQSLQYYNFAERIALADSEELQFVRLIMRLDTVEIVNYRKYIKLQDILSNLGGLWQILATPITQLSYKILILNSLFNFEGAELVQEEDDQNTMSMKSSVKNISQTVNSMQIELKSNHTPRARNRSQQSKNKLENDSLNLGQEKLMKLILQKRKLDKISNEVDIDILNKDIQLKKLQTVKDIAREMRRYFQTTSRKLRLNIPDYIQFCCKYQGKNKQKSNQIQYSISKVDKNLDVLYIIKKLNEIDKLKMIILSPEQIKLFDYLSKPLIPLNPHQIEEKENYWTILKKEKSDFQRALEAQKSYTSISKQQNISINQKLIKMMDPNVLQLFQIDVNFEDQRIDTPIPAKQMSARRHSESDCEYQEADQDEKYGNNDNDNENQKIKLPSILNDKGSYIINNKRRESSVLYEQC